VELAVFGPWRKHRVADPDDLPAASGDVRSEAPVFGSASKKRVEPAGERSPAMSFGLEPSVFGSAARGSRGVRAAVGLRVTSGMDSGDLRIFGRASRVDPGDPSRGIGSCGGSVRRGSSDPGRSSWQADSLPVG
jgi:hypothetical protein